ncbi:MAG TPA: hypothetical protein EYP85_06110, partial [Armatimonadetes bacterium]|nr:hypothetical protein [Armatimonadota bacterium]
MGKILQGVLDKVRSYYEGEIEWEPVLTAEQVESFLQREAETRGEEKVPGLWEDLQIFLDFLDFSSEIEHLEELEPWHFSYLVHDFLPEEAGEVKPSEGRRLLDTIGRLYAHLVEAKVLESDASIREARAKIVRGRRLERIEPPPIDGSELMGVLASPATGEEIHYHQIDHWLILVWLFEYGADWQAFQWDLRDEAEAIPEAAEKERRLCYLAQHFPTLDTLGPIVLATPEPTEEDLEEAYEGIFEQPAPYLKELNDAANLPPPGELEAPEPVSFLDQLAEEWDLSEQEYEVLEEAATQGIKNYYLWRYGYDKYDEGEYRWQAHTRLAEDNHLWGFVVLEVLKRESASDYLKDCVAERAVEITNPLIEHGIPYNLPAAVAYLIRRGEWESEDLRDLLLSFLEGVDNSNSEDVCTVLTATIDDPEAGEELKYALFTGLMASTRLNARTLQTLFNAAMSCEGWPMETKRNLCETLLSGDWEYSPLISLPEEAELLAEDLYIEVILRLIRQEFGEEKMLVLTPSVYRRAVGWLPRLGLDPAEVV